ncbi:MAG: glycosyltransferase family 9 protein [Phycisphaerales bacterium]|nr:glycosyltransferase family 9 protein [Phycisphaerales bacterium]
MSDPKRILLIRPSALGDVCRSVPLAASLKAAFPHADLDWLVQSGFEAAVAHHPAVTRVITFQRREMALAKLWKPAGAGRLRQLLGELRRAHYDLVIDAQGLARSGFFAWATRAPRRVGFANARELGHLGLTQRVEVPKEMHTVDRMLALVEALGVEARPEMRLYAGETDQAAVPAALTRGRYAVVAPTSRWAGKRWAADRFAALMARMLEHDAVDAIAVVGAHSERAQCAPITEAFAGDPRVHDLIGGTSVGGLMAVIERAAIVIANDSAALHMAVGFDRPMVGLYGPTRIDRVGPYRRAQDVIQPTPPAMGTSHKHTQQGSAAMGQIQVEQVLDAILQRLRPRGVESSSGQAHKEVAPRH